MYYNALYTQLAVVTACFIFLTLRQVEAQQSGCSKFFQLQPLPVENTQNQAAKAKNAAKAGGRAQFVNNSTRQPQFKSTRKVIQAVRPETGPGRDLVVKNGDNLFFQPTKATKAVAGGEGICGNYDTNEVLGVCLWSGEDQTGKDPTRSGWLSGSAPENCGREVEVFRASAPDKKITAKLVDGCSFFDKAFEVGCENLFVTKKLLAAIDPAAKGQIKDLNWNFKDIRTIF